MPTIELKDLARTLRKDHRARTRRVKREIPKLASKATQYMRKSVPVAFGELRTSVHQRKFGDDGTDIVADAPYASAVELGSRPHWAPFEAILKWVRMRGMTGLSKAGHVISNRTRSGGVKDWRKEASKSIASKLKSTTTDYDWRSGRAVGQHSPVDAAHDLAMSIWISISKRGTKPQPFGLPTSQYIESMLAGGALAKAVGGGVD